MKCKIQKSSGKLAFGNAVRYELLQAYFHKDHTHST